MAYRISDACIKCGACVSECPVNVITEGEDRFIIDEDSCVSCGSCAGVCPVSAPEEQ